MSVSKFGEGAKPKDRSLRDRPAIAYRAMHAGKKQPNGRGDTNVEQGRIQDF